MFYFLIFIFSPFYAVFVVFLFFFYPDLCKSSVLDHYIPGLDDGKYLSCKDELVFLSSRLSAKIISKTRNTTSLGSPNNKLLLLAQGSSARQEWVKLFVGKSGEGFRKPRLGPTNIKHHNKAARVTTKYFSIIQCLVQLLRYDQKPFYIGFNKTLLHEKIENMV